MNKNIDDLLGIIGVKHIPEGNVVITIIFHAGNWTDILISTISENNEMMEIAKTGFVEILKDCKFPAHGKIEFDLFLRNKRISELKIKITERIHNNSGRKM